MLDIDKTNCVTCLTPTEPSQGDRKSSEERGIPGRNTENSKQDNTACQEGAGAPPCAPPASEDCICKKICRLILLENAREGAGPPFVS